MILNLLNMLYVLCGSSGSGKDTIADYLINKYDFVKLSFADCLKDVVSIIFNWDRKLLNPIVFLPHQLTKRYFELTDGYF